MGFINLAEKTISAKLVYYGVGMGGKTTSLQAVHSYMVSRNEAQLVSIKTEGDATLLFDFLPINLGQVEGFKIRIQGYTVPGQPKYRLMRKYVLQGADGVVLVVDSERSRLEENLHSLQSLKENLVANGLDPQTIPIVLQYNKRDLDDILTEGELDAAFRFRDDMVSFPSVANEGQGVFEAFTHAAGLLVESRVRHYGLGRGEVNPVAVARGAVEKLWQTHDRIRGITRPREAQVELNVIDEAAARAEADFEAELQRRAESEGGVFDEAELAVDLAASGLREAAHALANAFPDEPEHDDDEHDSDGLLDKTIRSNLGLAERFGELDRQRILLERQNRELIEIAQNTVHDLRRPLAAIRLFLSSLTKGIFGRIEGPLAGGAHNSLLAARHMERLIQDLVDSSRLDFDGVRLQFEPTDLSVLAAEVLQTLRAELEETDAVVCVSALPTMLVDSWALTKVLTNLIGNALQYAHPDRRPRIDVCADQFDDRVVLRVCDNGIGIPAEDAGRLFRRFERGSNTAGISGHGLGLHIVREAVAGHGGRVWVESTEGEGATFFLSLPREPVQPEHDPLAETAEAADL